MLVSRRPKASSPTLLNMVTDRPSLARPTATVARRAAGLGGEVQRAGRRRQRHHVDQQLAQRDDIIGHTHFTSLPVVAFLSCLRKGRYRRRPRHEPAPPPSLAKALGPQRRSGARQVCRRGRSSRMQRQKGYTPLVRLREPTHAFASTVNRCGRGLRQTPQPEQRPSAGSRHRAATSRARAVHETSTSACFSSRAKRGGPSRAARAELAAIAVRTGR